MRRVFLARVRSRHLLAASAVPAVGITDASQESSALNTPRECSALNQVLRSLTLAPLLVFFALTFSAGTAWAGGDANRGAGECTAAAEAAPGFSQLPDCRGYELVTPPLKNSSLFDTLFTTKSPQVASSGDQVTSYADQCLPQSESCVPLRYDDGDPYLFTRASSGWFTSALAPPASEFETDSYYTVDPDTGMALFSAPGPPAGQDNFYSRSETGVFSDIGPLGENSTDEDGEICVSPGCVASTGDLSHVVFNTNASLWAFDHTKRHALYEYTKQTGNTRPLLVGVTGSESNPTLVSTCETQPGAGTRNTTYDNALSEDGRIVYFLAVGRDDPECEQLASKSEAPPVYELWARVDGELPDAHSVLISGPAEKGTSGGPGEGCESAECVASTTVEGMLRDPSFEGASRDGSRVFFTDTQQLTDGASEDPVKSAAETACSHIDEPGGCNLYESECPGSCEDAASERRLIDISEGAKKAGGPRVQGVMAVSADGSYVYFVAKGKLTGEETNQNGEKAVEEDDNLYVYTAGHVSFIARLDPADHAEEQWVPGTNVRANITPDGQFLVFEDDSALTADDTRPEGEKAAQIYEYDAATNHLTRISVGENGFDSDGNGETGNAAIVNASNGGSEGNMPLRQDPTMSENGALVFFESPIALTPGALGDVRVTGVEEPLAQNVYEYHDGQVFLISDGRDTTGRSATPPYANGGSTGLVGVSSSGGDVFFSTFDSLAPQDTDTQLDFYDAHVCSEASPCIPPPAEPAAACEGEACQGPASAPPVFGVPTSNPLTSSGNIPGPAATTSPPKTTVKKLTKCKKSFVKKNNKCVKAKRAKKAKAKKASRDRRASR